MWVLGCLISAAGCHATHPKDPAFGLDRLPPVYESMPRELSKVALPEYVIEPPDVLLIEGVHVVPKAPYRLKTLDVLAIQVSGTLPDAEISGTYSVEPGGLVNLGVDYGSVRVSGMTVEEAEDAIVEHLRKYLSSPGVAVALAQMAASQQILGEFLVQPDGTITLGSYGSVSVVGKTITQAKAAIESYLTNYLEDPEISLTVQSFNSKVYYIVMQGAGLGDGVYRFPDYRQRNGLGRDLEHTGFRNGLVQEDLDCPSHQRYVQPADHAGRLVRDHRTCGTPDQLPVAAG